MVRYYPQRIEADFAMSWLFSLTTIAVSAPKLIKDRYADLENLYEIYQVITTPRVACLT